MSNTRYENTERLGRILDLAGRLFAEKGYQGTSMREIARGVGLDVANLYRYVPSKGDLVVLMAQEVNRAVATSLRKALCQADDPLSALRIAFFEYLRLVDKYGDHYRIFYRCFDWLAPNLRELLLEGELEIVKLFQGLLEDLGYSHEDAHCLAWDLTVLGEMWAVKRWAFHSRMGLEQYIRRQWRVAEASLNAFKTEAKIEDIAAQHSAEMAGQAPYDG